MTSHTIFLHILPQNGRNKPFFLREITEKRESLPHFVKNCPVAMRYLDLLSPLAWSDFPERRLKPYFCAYRPHFYSTPKNGRA